MAPPIEQPVVQASTTGNFGLLVYNPFIPIEGDPSTAATWDKWMRGLESMINAMRVTDIKHKYSLLHWYVGDDFQQILNELENNGGTEEDYEKAKVALNGYFNPQMNAIYLLHAALQLQQSSLENMDKFHMRVKEKMSLVELSKKSADEIEKLFILVILIAGCRKSELRKRTLKDGLSLSDFLKLARATEMAETQTRGMEEHANTSSAVNAIAKNGKPKKFKKKYEKNVFKKKRDSPPQKYEKYEKSAKSCFNCGGSFPHAGGMKKMSCQDRMVWSMLSPGTLHQNVYVKL